MSVSDFPGPLILDLEGTELSDEESRLLLRPHVGGIILFSRNYRDREQLLRLVKAIRAVNPGLLIAVDHEGGRVQRFRHDFTRIPPMQVFADYYRNDPDAALRDAGECGWLLAAELLDVGVDISFAPVLDVDRDLSSIIGDRAFSDNPQAVCELARAFIDGMHKAGMAVTGKHYPGHGGVVADSHLELPVDQRSLEDLQQRDLVPFLRLGNQLDALMPAHIVFPQVDSAYPVGFSHRWLQEILREEQGFNGVIFSDDLTMEGAAGAGTFARRAELAFDAGCDVVLVCNHRDGALQVLDWLEAQRPSLRAPGLAGMRSSADLPSQGVRWQRARDRVASLERWLPVAPA